MTQANTRKTLSLRDALSRVIPLCCCALFLAAAIISVTNDMYAFVKADEEVTVTVSSRLDLNGLSKRLSDVGIVKNPFVFSLYLRSKGVDERIQELNGQWILNKNMSYREIMLEIF